MVSSAKNGKNLIAVLLDSGRSEPFDFDKLIRIGRSTPRDLSQGCVGCDDVRRNGVTIGALSPPVLQTAQNCLLIW